MTVSLRYKKRILVYVDYKKTTFQFLLILDENIRSGNAIRIDEVRFTQASLYHKTA